MENPTPSCEALLMKLKEYSNEETFQTQSRFGIQGATRLGVSLYDIRRLAKGIKNHELALELWDSGIHEARMLASIVDEPHRVDLQQLREWVVCFDSWDICDEVTDELFIHVDGMLELIPEWANRSEEFVKRAAFAMIAALVVHRNDIPDEKVYPFFGLIEAAANDERNFVKKAVNWALRNIAKYRPSLRTEAFECANRILSQESKSAKWIAKDAIKEFNLKFGGIHEFGSKV